MVSKLALYAQSTRGVISGRDCLQRVQSSACRSSRSSQATSQQSAHKGINWRSKDVTKTQQQRVESPTVTLTWPDMYVPLVEFMNLVFTLTWPDMYVPLVEFMNLVFTLTWPDMCVPLVEFMNLVFTLTWPDMCVPLVEFMNLVFTLTWPDMYHWWSL